MVLFARVAEAGSFAAAARELGLTRAAVGQQMARLEAHVGARLLQRTTRRMGLTELGEAFLAHCQRLRDEAEEGIRVVAALQGAPRGTLRVSAPVSFGTRHLAPLLPAFLAERPEMRVDLQLGDAFVDLIRDRFDLVVRIREPEDSSLVARKLATIRRVAVAAPAYLRERAAPKTPAALREHACLVYTGSESPELWRFGRAGVRVRGRLRSNDGDVLREAALAGAGVAFLPTFLVGEDIARGRLVHLLPAYVDERLRLHALHARREGMAPKVRAFLDFLDARLCRQPPWDGFLARRPT